MDEQKVLRKALADFCNAFSNRGETTSLAVWNGRMKRAYEDAILALRGESPPLSPHIGRTLSSQSDVCEQHGQPMLYHSLDVERRYPHCMWCEVDENDRLSKKLAAVKQIVDKQTDDEGCWFDAKTAPEAYLQQELRALHAIVEQV